MRFEIELTDNASDDYGHLDARWRATLKSALEDHLRYEPRKESKSRSKRLEGLDWPEYRLSVDELRVFYEIEDSTVYILGIVYKDDADEWLQTFGRPQA